MASGQGLVHGEEGIRVFQEVREGYTVSLRKTNQLDRSKAFAHPFCINSALKVQSASEGLGGRHAGVAPAQEELQARPVQKHPAIKAVFHLLCHPILCFDLNKGRERCLQETTIKKCFASW